MPIPQYQPDTKAIIKRRLNIDKPSTTQCLQWLSHIAGFRIFRMKPSSSASITSPLRLNEIVGPADLEDIYYAARFSNALADFKPLGETITRLESDLGGSIDDAIPLDTGLKVGRKAVLFRQRKKIILAFEATKPGEMKMNAWSHAQDRKWSVPYARYHQGKQVHSFYLDMWLGMRRATFKTLKEAVDRIVEEGGVPEKVLITGHSMGGGISVLAMMDIVEYIRKTYGSLSHNEKNEKTNPSNPWASDENLGSLIRHVTFAEFASAGNEYTSHLNEWYQKYNIPAWDFVHPHDFTTRLHLPFFRVWRGHRYVLPDEACRGFEKEYAAGRHDMPGYMRSMKWLRDNPRELRSLYTYPSG